MVVLNITLANPALDTFNSADSKFLFACNISLNKVDEKHVIGISLLLSELILNLILLTYRTLAPSQEMFAYYSKVYQIAKKEKILVVTLYKDFYEYASLKIDYCQSPNVETNHFKSMEELNLFTGEPLSDKVKSADNILDAFANHLR